MSAAHLHLGSGVKADHWQVDEFYTGGRPATRAAGLLQRGVGDTGGDEADALVGHLGAGIPCGDGDLLGNVAVAVEARLAGQHLEAAAEASVGGF